MRCIISSCHKIKNVLRNKSQYECRYEYMTASEVTSASKINTGGVGIYIYMYIHIHIYYMYISYVRPFGPAGDAKCKILSTCNM